MALPTPRKFLTSLINTLTSLPPPPPPPAPDPGKNAFSIANESTNPLKLVPLSHRALLTTLHVIIPPPTLLQALDLLDRGLVTRIHHDPGLDDLDADSRPRAGRGKDEGKARPPQAPVPLPELAAESGVDERKTAEFYLVRSSQVPRGRGRDRGGDGEGGKVYTVRLHAWNCDCAAFAFAAFPGASSSSFSWEESSGDGDGYGDREGIWEFGGESLDGRGGEDHVPICKHLLACLLGEKWDGVLGSYVKERGVGREEAAGLAVG
ncbi:hypothetical protein B0O99DRAFT_688488 [Bisporella sp. PMI_857]|nr:hypothetical protein B0O99DRAFT_688488 [Bisporella sp. PMI_857]